MNYTIIPNWLYHKCTEFNINLKDMLDINKVSSILSKEEISFYTMVDYLPHNTVNSLTSGLGYYRPKDMDWCKDNDLMMDMLTKRMPMGKGFANHDEWLAYCIMYTGPAMMDTKERISGNFKWTAKVLDENTIALIPMKCIGTNPNELKCSYTDVIHTLGKVLRHSEVIELELYDNFVEHLIKCK